jgi:anthranilate phosphoribosyltransferase
MTKITEYLEIILEGDDLTFEQAKRLLDTIFEGDVSEVQIAAFLAAMRVKKASVSELAGLATSLRNHAVRVEAGIDNLVDTCGTGGAKQKTFNISTAAAIVAAGAGVYIAKHGNRGITSKCGSADVLAELGVNIEASPERTAECIREVHIGFMFAPRFHPAMKHVQPIRQSLDFRTAFNVLGPLANPAGAKLQLIGVSEESLCTRMAETLKMLGNERAMVVWSNGLDEISTMWPTKIVELNDGKITEREIKASDFGITAASLDELKGGDAKSNAKIIKEIIAGKDRGKRRDIVLLNAAAAVIIGNLADDFPAAIKIAAESINSGKAEMCLEKLIKISNSKG